MTKRISTTVAEELYEIAKRYNINWAEALRVGLVILAGSYGFTQYQNLLNKSRVKALAECYGFEVTEPTDSIHSTDQTA